MREEIMLLREQNKQLQAMKQSKTQFLDAERKCNANDPKKQLTPSKIAAGKVKTPPTREMAREQAKVSPSNGKP